MSLQEAPERDFDCCDCRPRTGGMSLGTGRYELRLKALTNQEQSQDLLSKAITDLRKDSDKASWKK